MSALEEARKSVTVTHKNDRHRGFSHLLQFSPFPSTLGILDQWLGDPWILLFCADWGGSWQLVPVVSQRGKVRLEVRVKLQQSKSYQGCLPDHTRLNVDLSISRRSLDYDQSRKAQCRGAELVNRVCPHKSQRMEAI